MEPNRARLQYFEAFGRRLRNQQEIVNKFTLAEINDPLKFIWDGKSYLERVQTRLMRRRTICNIANTVYKMDHNEYEFYENSHILIEMATIMEESWLWSKCRSSTAEYNLLTNNLINGLLFGNIIIHFFEVDGCTSFVFRRLRLPVREADPPRAIPAPELADIPVKRRKS